ncbi:MAG: hypothetical protein FJ292_04950 [Planctomycetes bacterium]|nr:hypothetical protein [Planctomycetota bacterium]
MKRENLFASLAAFASLTGFASLCYAQVCDTDSAGNLPADTAWEYNVDSDYDGSDDPDENGGCNLGEPAFAELGTLAPGAYRAKGLTGNYLGSDGGNRRDLDWWRFTVTQPCYIKVTVSMSKDGVPFSALGDPATQSVVFVATGPSTADNTVYCGDEGALFIYGQGLTTDCPQVVEATLPNGTTSAKVPVPAGQHMIVVTTPFDEARYTGPINYAIDLEIVNLDNASCGTSTNNCTDVNTSPGCNDPLCCDTVCLFVPDCCNVGWDASCIQTGVEECGLFVYECVTNASVPNDCAGQAEFIDATTLPITFGFDASQATNDGPNNVNALCSSNTTRDVWYVVGPLPYDGELRASMCDAGNTGDAVLSVYGLGTDTAGTPISSLDDGSKLPDLYIGCRDDVCDDNDDGQLDFGGPAGINLIGVLKDEYYMLRLGSFLDAGQDPNDPSIAGLTGSLNVSFRAQLFSNGAQEALAKADGTNVNLGWISGVASSTNPKRWMFVPFSTLEPASVNGFDFTAFGSDSGVADRVAWKVIARNSADTDHGAFSRPFGAGMFDASQVLFEGIEPFDIEAFADVGDRYGQRYFVDLSAAFELAAGDYYFTCYGDNSEGTTTGTYFAWLSYGIEGIPDQYLLSLNNTGTNPAGPTVAGKAFGWRGIGPGPEMIAYQLFEANGTTESYTPQSDDNQGLTFQPAFSIKGDLAVACFGDLDGNNEVDNGDVAFCLLDFGQCPGCAADLDGTNEVDFGDVALILLSTGPCS